MNTVVPTVRMESSEIHLVNPDHPVNPVKNFHLIYRIDMIYKMIHQCPTSTNGDQKNGCGISFNILNCAARRLVDNEEPAFKSR